MATPAFVWISSESAQALRASSALGATKPKPKGGNGKGPKKATVTQPQHPCRTATRMWVQGGTAHLTNLGSNPSPPPFKL